MVPFCDKLKHVKKSLKVKIFLNFYGAYIKVSWVADIYTTLEDVLETKKVFSGDICI